MLIIVTEEKRVGSTDVEFRKVAFDPDTIHRMVPKPVALGIAPDELLETVVASFEDGEEMTLVGGIHQLVEQINGPGHPLPRPAFEDLDPALFEDAYRDPCEPES
jgi:hypothetical protein